MLRRQIGYLVAQAYRTLGARRRAVARATAPGVRLPVVCHALTAPELDRLLGWLKAHGVRVWLSFDDGWCETAACVPVLEKYGQEAVLFVAPGETLRGNVWTDAAQQLGVPDVVWRGWYGLPAAEREARLAGMGGSTVRRLMTEEEIRALARHPLVRLGNHTWSHLSAPHRPEAEVLAEVDRAQAILTDWAGGRVPVDFAYPFGRGTPALDAALRARGLAVRYTSQGLDEPGREPRARNMAIENVTFAENLGRLLMAWPKVGVTL